MSDSSVEHGNSSSTGSSSSSSSSSSGDVLTKTGLLSLAGSHTDSFWQDQLSHSITGWQSQDPSRQGDGYEDDEERSLPVTAILHQLHSTSHICDIYPSYDWGRDFGIDNRTRVHDMLQHLSTCFKYKVFQEDYTTDVDENRQNIIKCRHVIVFLTDRYLRRIGERSFLYENFNDCLQRCKLVAQNKAGEPVTGLQTIQQPMTMIIAIMEERVSRKKEMYLKALGLNPELINTPLCVDVWDLKTDAATHARRIHEAIVKTGLYLHHLFQKETALEENRIPPHSLNELSIVVSSYTVRHLLKAVEDGNIEEMKAQLSQGAFDYHKKYYFPFSVASGGNNEHVISTYLLHRIVGMQHIALLKEFLTHVMAHDNNGWSLLNLVDDEGCTALHIACKDLKHDNKSTCDAIISLLLEYKVNPNILDNYGFTALHYAIQQDDIALVSLLIRHKADVFARTRDGDSDIDLAVSTNMKEFLEKIHSRKRAILIACQQGDVGSVRELLSTSQRTCIKVDGAVELELEAEVNICNEDGRSPLYFAATHNYTEIVEILLREGNADPNIADNWGTSPLCETAMMHDNVQIIELLLAAGASIEATNCHGNTALMNAAQGGNFHMVKGLIAAGAELNLTNSHYYKGDQPLKSPIEAAFEGGHINIVQLLLHHGAKISPLLLDKLISLHRVLPQDHVSLADQVEWHPEVLARFANEWSYVTNPGKMLFSYEALNANNFAIWFAIVQLENTENDSKARLVEALVISLAKQFPNLIHVKDTLGRSANVVATTRHRVAMNSLFLWHGRYRPASMRKEHCSITSFVYRAYDEQAATSSKDGTVEDLAAQEPVQVAIKCFRYKKHFLRELELRRQYILDSKFVINSDQHFFPVKGVNIGEKPTMKADNNRYNEEDGPEDCLVALFSNSISLDRDWQKDEIEQMYSIVMPYCDRNMFVAIKQERFAGTGSNVHSVGSDADSRGSDQEQVKTIFRQIVYAVDHLHRQGIVHGDLKPLNIMRHDSRWKLIDLDASGRIGRDFLLQKYSSAFIPPEGLVEILLKSMSENETSNRDKPTIMVRSPEIKDWLKTNPTCKGSLNSDDEPTFLLRAQPSFDIWSLGVILYQLCSRDAVALFQAGQDDNLLSEEFHENDDSRSDTLRSLWNWSDETKKRKLSLIPDPMARNLISLLLTKDASRRPTTSRILAHPFLSGNTKKLVRLSNMNGIDAYEPPEFDCFLSYRVATDLPLVEAVYEMLTKKGFKVWWDKQCLTLGKDWQQSFCEGLMKSRCYICFLSKAGVNHPTNPRQSFAFKQSGHCDNLLLEIRLALELHRFGYVERLVPLFIGEMTTNETTVSFSEFDFPSCWPQAQNIVIESIEDALQRELSDQCLGDSVLAVNRDDITVSSLLSALTKCQGIFVKGSLHEAAQEITKSLSEMMGNLQQLDSNSASPRSHIHVKMIKQLSSKLG